ncbi:MAG: hypothetical protein NVS3B12_14160 [Acidimicrobiales bacterium]
MHPAATLTIVEVTMLRLTELADRARVLPVSESDPVIAAPMRSWAIARIGG